MSHIEDLARENPFWKPLAKAFQEADGFTVTFHLESGQTLTDLSVRLPEDHAIMGEKMDAESGVPSKVSIRMGYVAAYEIEEQ
jgi:hypothetical protein